MPGKVPPHWLRLNDSVSSPDAFIVLDTETTWETGERVETHRPRCWALTLADRRYAGASYFLPGADGPHPVIPKGYVTGHRDVVTLEASGPSMVGLVDTVEAMAAVRPETWLFAHNLGFDLAVSALPERLVEDGWAMPAYWIGDESTWAVFKKDGRRLVCTDSWSWLSAPLAEIAHRLKSKKRPLPANDGTPADWAARCRTDVDILLRALLELMGWWDTNDLGRFGITGAGCGWAAARHRMRPKSILVGPDPERNSFERQAIYGGRREAFTVGAVKRALFSDFDLVAAYPTVAATLNLPRRPVRRFADLRADHPWIGAQSVGIIARAVIGTDTPCIPCRIGGEVWWPVGTFPTTLAGPEIALALELGAKVEIGPGWCYDLGDGLKPWAQWIVELQDPDNTAVPPLVKMMAKGWGRSVLGRFASRTSREILRRPATAPGWSLEHGRHQESGSPLDILTIGGEERWLLQDQEGRDSLPALFAWVESACRAALTRIILSRPAGSVLQCDTDGWLEREAYRRQPDIMPEAPWPHRVARKGRYSSVQIIGPTHLELDKASRWAGVSQEREPTDSGAFSWWDWPGLRWQLQHAEHGTYQRQKRETRVHYDVVKRWVFRDGTTQPVSARLGPDGEAELVLDPDVAWNHLQGRLAGEQHPRLAALLD